MRDMSATLEDQRLTRVDTHALDDLDDDEEGGETQKVTQIIPHEILQNKYICVESFL